MTKWILYFTEPDGDTSIYFCEQEPRWGQEKTIVFIPTNGPDPGDGHTIPTARLQRIVERLAA